MLGAREQRGVDGRDVHGQASVLAILSVSEHSTNLDVVGQGPTVWTVGEGGGCFGHFFSPLSILCPISPSLGDGFQTPVKEVPLHSAFQYQPTIVLL